MLRAADFVSLARIEPDGQSTVLPGPLIPSSVTGLRAKKAPKCIPPH